MALGSRAVGILDEIARLVDRGYPDTVAEGIATGRLPMDFESRMQRAEAMGFDPSNVQYHGTEADFTKFVPSSRGKMGPGVYTTPSQSTASTFSGYPSPYAEGANVMPLLLRGEYINRADAFDLRPEITGREGQRILNETLQDMGYAGTQAGGRGSLSPESVTFDPSNIRSYLSAAFDPEYKGSNILGSGLLGATALGATLAPQDAEAGFIDRGGRTLLEAWHGSPHKFDRFSSDYIGTGEGAQAYGHGLYFADSQDVARQYRDMLARSPRIWLPQILRDNGLSLKDVGVNDFNLYAGAKNASVDDAVNLIINGKDTAITRRNAGLSDEEIDRESLRNAVIQYRNETKYGEPLGALYRAEIDVTPDQLLDWDKPLSQQSEGVRDILRNNEGLLRERLYTIGDNFEESYLNGEALYSAIQRELRGENPSAFLSDLGIKGIRYYDGDSRSTADGVVDSIFQDEDGKWRGRIRVDNRSVGFTNSPTGSVTKSRPFNTKEEAEKWADNAINNGTSNYVIFDDSLINIAERGAATPAGMGIAGLLGAGGIAAMSPEQQIEEAQRQAVTAPSIELQMLNDPEYQSLLQGYGGARPYTPALNERMVEGVAQGLLDSGIISNPYSARDAAEGITLISDFMPIIGEGKGFAEARDYWNRGEYGKAILTGGLTALGPAAGLMSMFIGPAARNADTMMMDFAKRMEDAGVSAREIWQKTGWGRGADGQWRTEVSDVGSTFTLPEGEALQGLLDGSADPPFTTLERVYENPQVFEAYPELRTYPVRLMESLSSGGSFSPETGIFEFNALLNGLPGELESTAAHEVQHAIQTIEGFNRGGNVQGSQLAAKGAEREEAQFLSEPKYVEALRKEQVIRSQLGSLRPMRIISDMENIGRPKDLFNSNLWYEHSDEVRRRIGPPPRRSQASLEYAQKAGREIAKILREKPEYFRAAEELDDIGRDEVRRRIRNLEGQMTRIRNNPTWQEAYYATDAWNQRRKMLANEEPRETYERLAGETESRSTQTRLPMTESERRSTPPWVSEDVPRRHQIPYYLTDLWVDGFPDRNKMSALYPSGLLGD